MFLGTQNLIWASSLRLSYHSIKSLAVRQWKNWGHSLNLETENISVQIRFIIVYIPLDSHESVDPEEFRDRDSKDFSSSYDSEFSGSNNSLENVKINDKRKLSLARNFYDCGYDTEEDWDLKANLVSEFVVFCKNYGLQNSISSIKGQYSL